MASSRRSTLKAKKTASFYERINKTWIHDTAIPPTESRITQTYYIQEIIHREIAHVIRDESVKPGPIAELLHSWDTTNGKIPIGITSLTQIMLTMNTNSDIASRIGWMNRYGVTPPLSINVRGNPRNHTKCCIFIEEGEPGIGSPDFHSHSEFAEHRKAYALYVKELAKILAIPAILQGYNAEKEFASVFPKIKATEDRIHIISWYELNRDFKQIDWITLFTAWGLQEQDLPRLVYNVASTSFLHHLQNRIELWSMEKWQGWFALIVAQWIAGCSPHGALRTAWFNYNRRFLQGLISDESVGDLRTNIVMKLMPNTIGKLWVKRYCDSHIPKHVLEMVMTIRNAASTSLTNTQWMSSSTRAAAIRKLRAMELQIGWPSLNGWEPKEIACTLNSSSLIDNLLSLSKLATDENQSMLVRGDCRYPNGAGGWGNSVFEVNAYYYPDENKFILPAAILRPPFYDSTQSLAWKYGAIGATIGHELCHAFDAEGRLFDEHGDKRDWWTKHDDREYRRRSKQVVRLFDNTPYKGLAVNGELTLIENIADLGGLEFALAGLKAAMKPGGVSRDDLRDFFTAFAVSWRSKDRLRRAEQLLTIDVHAPPQLRVDLVVRQMDDWYYAFDITDTSPDWIEPSKRIRFFG